MTRSTEEQAEAKRLADLAWRRQVEARCPEAPDGTGRHHIAPFADGPRHRRCLNCRIEWFPDGSLLVP